MFRYIAFAWNAADLQQAQAVTLLQARMRSAPKQWHCALDQPGVLVYYVGERCGSTTAHLLQGGRGVVLGTVFKKPSSDSQFEISERASFDTATSTRIVATGGRELVGGGYWGNYVAVLHDACDSRTWVLRGPSSSLPCFRVTHGQVEVCFSLMEDFLRLDLGRPSINWEYLAVHVVARIGGEHTGLHGVSQLRPGECIDIAYGCVSKRMYWNALELCGNKIIEDPDEAAIALRQVVRMGVHAWASCHESIVLNLSGGLDSSIVLACLKDAPTRPRLTCVTEHSPGSDSDEREYARLAMRNFGCGAYLERRRNSSIRLEGMLRAAPSAIPQGYIRCVETSDWQAQLARECDATAIFSGSGGDQVFYQNTARLGVADFVYRHGIGSGLARIAYDSAQLEGLSIWRVLAEALYRGLMPPRQFDPLADVFQYRTLVHHDVIDALRAKNGMSRWWYQPASDVPPGKHRHVDALSNPDDYYNPMGHEGDPEQIAPLFSQPIIELAVRIPTYVLVIGGWDRGLARNAFTEELPSEIARRRSKGGIAEHTQQILRENLPFARELLLDGLMVKNGLLDCDKVDEALADRPSGVMKGMAEICHHLSTEAWLRQWSEEGGRTAAG